MKDISKKTVNILLVIYLIIIVTQAFFTINHPSILTGKASSATAKISVTILSPAPAPPSEGGKAVTPKKCAPLWICTDWGSCTKEEVQYRTCTDVRNCNTTEGKPPESRVCLYAPTCFDEILNGYETDIDCGGQYCMPCEDGKRCRIDRDCINKCNSTISVCYSPPLILPLVIEPAPMNLGQKIIIFMWSVIRIAIFLLALVLFFIILVLFIYFRDKKNKKND